METFSALLAICVGNSPVPGEFHAQRPVARSFDVCFDLRLNKRLGKQSWGWWFETLSRPLWRHRDGPSQVKRAVSTYPGVTEENHHLSMQLKSVGNTATLNYIVILILPRVFCSDICHISEDTVWDMKLDVFLLKISFNWHQNGAN